MSRLPKPAPGLGDYLREQRRRVRQQGYSSAFARSGLNVTGEGEIASDDFDGDIPNGDAGTAGWGASGDTLAAGNLLLRPRSIGDDSLSSLVRPGSTATTQFNFSVQSSDKNVALQSVPIPDGFTSALVTVVCNATAQNTSTTADYIYVASYINAPTGGGTGGKAFTSVPAGSWGSASASGISQIDGMSPGDSVTCGVIVSCGSGWTAQGANTANMNATIIWFR